MEGVDDQKVIEHLFRWYQCSGICEIRDQKGVAPLLEAVPVMAKGSVDCFGVVLDADFDVAARWQALSLRLQNAGYVGVPREPQFGGLIIDSSDLPRVGVWVMPNNSLPGMLEDFVRLLVPSEDVLWTYAEQVVQEVAAKDRRFIPEHFSKARIHTWLAWQEEPGTPMGLSITKRYLNAAAPPASAFVAWARALFADSPGQSGTPEAA